MHVAQFQQYKLVHPLQYIWNAKKKCESARKNRSGVQIAAVLLDFLAFLMYILCRVIHDNHPKRFGAREQAADNQPCNPLSSRCARGIPVHHMFSQIHLPD